MLFAFLIPAIPACSGLHPDYYPTEDLPDGSITRARTEANFQSGPSPYDCGPEAASFLLNHWGKEAHPASLRESLMRDPEKGTPARGLISLFRRRSLDVRPMAGTWRLLRQAIDHGYIPLIMVEARELHRFPGLMDYLGPDVTNHYFPVVGYAENPEGILVETPDGEYMLNKELLRRTWLPTEQAMWLVWEPGHHPNPEGREKVRQQYERARNLEENGRQEEARRVFRDITRKNPFYAPAYSALGNQHLRMNNLQKAEEFFRKAIRRDDTLFHIYNNLAWTLLKREGNLRHAEEFATLAIDRITYYLHILQRNIDTPLPDTLMQEPGVLRDYLQSLFHTRGRIRLERDRPAKAASDFQASLTYTPESGDESFRSELYRYLGEAYLLQGEEERALHTLKKSLEHRPSTDVRNSIENLLDTIRKRAPHLQQHRDN